MRKKASIELSANVIVTIIISVVIMSIGFVILFKVVDSGEDQLKQTTYKTEQELVKLQNSGSKFFIVDSVQEGTPGKNSIFGVGVFNRAVPSASFKIKARFKGDYYDSDGNLGSFDQGNVVIDYDGYTVHNLAKNEGFSTLLSINIPKENAKPGTYYFFVYACSNSSSVGELDTNNCWNTVFTRKYAVGKIELKI